MVIGRVRHPGERAVEFTSFLSCNGAYTNISLRSNSCLCDACYRDCTRASGNGLGCLSMQCECYVARVSSKIVLVRKLWTGVHLYGMTMMTLYSCGYNTFSV